MKHKPLPAAETDQDNEDGFSLVELLVVIVILGLLATVVMINVLPSQDKAMQSKAKADIATLSQAVEMYRLNTLRYPDGAEGLNALLGGTSTAPGSTGGYIRKLPKDPWGKDYQYRQPGQHGAFDIY
ncbi:MAG: type II secretion system protein GspG, partial [Alphaproteobacteria bacterium PA3]